MSQQQKSEDPGWFERLAFACKQAAQAVLPSDSDDLAGELILLAFEGNFSDSQLTQAYLRQIARNILWDQNRACLDPGVTLADLIRIGILKEHISIFMPIKGRAHRGRARTVEATLRSDATIEYNGNNYGDLQSLTKAAYDQIGKKFSKQNGWIVWRYFATDNRVHPLNDARSEYVRKIGAAQFDNEFTDIMTDPYQLDEIPSIPDFKSECDMYVLSASHALPRMLKRTVHYSYGLRNRNRDDDDLRYLLSVIFDCEEQTVYHYMWSASKFIGDFLNVDPGLIRQYFFRLGLPENQSGEIERTG